MKFYGKLVKLEFSETDSKPAESSDGDGEQRCKRLDTILANNLKVLTHQIF
jgi:hypothetical protein